MSFTRGARRENYSKSKEACLETDPSTVFANGIFEELLLEASGEEVFLFLGLKLYVNS
jgi:hypothetical protein